MNNDIEVNKKVLYIEQKYDVNSWKHNGYHVWPIFRNALNKSLVRNYTKINIPKRKQKKNYSLNIVQTISTIIDIFSVRKDTKYLFYGAPAHCVDHNGQIYNRYFDPIMDSLNFNSLYLSKANTKHKVYKKDRHILINDVYKIFYYIDKFFRIHTKPTKHINIFCEILEKEGIKIEGFNKILENRIKTVDISYYMFKYLLKRLRPVEVMVLCYYSEKVYGMFIASHQLSIPTIDLQHGGIGKYDLYYANWTKVPQNGYEALPNLFYTWDKSSRNIINSWAKNNKKHSAEVFGNPWVDGWKQKKFQQSNYNWPENIILYTLQPIGEPLEDYIMKVIQKTKNKWDWWLRLHPRQTEELRVIENRLKDYGIYESVNIEEATFLPLPEILTHTAVHITKFSGCALEAYQFDVKSIIIDQRGVDLYKDYIDDGSVIVNLKENAHEFIKTIDELFQSAKRLNRNVN